MDGGTCNNVKDMSLQERLTIQLLQMFEKMNEEEILQYRKLLMSKCKRNQIFVKEVIKVAITRAINRQNN